MLNYKNLILISILTLSSCASYEHVRPGPDGIHKVVIRGVEKSEIEKMAITEAKNFCDERKQAAAVVTENTNYTGSMDEDTFKTIRTISKASALGGGMLEALGGKREKNLGKGVLGGGDVLSTFQDEDAYTTDMSFKCI